MGTAAFSWGVSRSYDLLLLHNSDDDDICIRSAASWDENQQVYGGRNEFTGDGYSLCFSKRGRIAVMVHPDALWRTSGTPGTGDLCFEFTTCSALPQVFAERCKLKPRLGYFYLIVADIPWNTMYYIKNTADCFVEYHKVTPGAYILSECGLNGMGRNDPTNAKSEALMVQFENMLSRDDIYNFQIHKTIMTNPTRADEDDGLSSVFVDTVGYGTVCTSSILVEKYITKDMYRFIFSERYRGEYGNWSEHHENFFIVDDFDLRVERKWLEFKKEKEAAEASTEAAEYSISIYRRGRSTGDVGESCCRESNGCSTTVLVLILEVLIRLHVWSFHYGQFVSKL